MSRGLVFAILTLLVCNAARAEAASFDQALLAKSVAQAGAFPRLHALIVARDGKPVVEQVFRGPSLDTAVNIKSASKTIIDALVGMAVDRGLIRDVNQPILPLLKGRAPASIPRSAPSRSIICSRCAPGWSGPPAGRITAAG